MRKKPLTEHQFLRRLSTQRLGNSTPTCYTRETKTCPPEDQYTDVHSDFIHAKRRAERVRVSVSKGMGQQWRIHTTENRSAVSTAACGTRSNGWICTGEKEAKRKGYILYGCTYMELSERQIWSVVTENRPGDAQDQRWLKHWPRKDTGDILGWWKCSICWLWYWWHRCISMSKVTMCTHKTGTL